MNNFESWHRENTRKIIPFIFFFPHRAWMDGYIYGNSSIKTSFSYGFLFVLFCFLSFVEEEIFNW